MTDSDLNTWNAFIGTLAAFGAVAVAILAIWGDWVRSRLIPPIMRIEPHNLRGTVTRLTGGRRVIYYHLKVVNSRRWAPAKNCHVLLRKVSKRDSHGIFHPIPLPVPGHFVWAPAGFTPTQISLSREKELDFFQVVEKDTKVLPVLYWYPNEFEGVVQANEVFRYTIEVVADGYEADRLYVFEVEWDGEWSDDLDVMAKHLAIQEIRAT